MPGEMEIFNAPGRTPDSAEGVRGEPTGEEQGAGRTPGSAEGEREPRERTKEHTNERKAE